MSREVGGIGEVVGVAVAGVVLLVMLGSLVLAGLPLAIALVGVGVSLATGCASLTSADFEEEAPVSPGFILAANSATAPLGQLLTPSRAKGGTE